MVRLQQNLLLLAANLLVPLTAVLFIVGFFRGQPGSSTPAGIDVNGKELVVSESAPFNKVIFMMVDALRSDFVYLENTGFKYTQSLIRSGAAIPFTARAASPTLTLSRIKALTQGTTQSFLDVWLNVFESETARSLAGADTWLSRLKSETDLDKKMVFYGADIWLDLYPDIFDRFEGTDAWYLPEFTTVDSNVTRHLPYELQNDDWKALVLHYLGLDNVAHQGGPSGAHIVLKQAEMDSVVEQIYKAIEHKPHLKNTLFVLLGDHGMNEMGNHGGDSPSEVASALTLISPRFKSISKGLESPVMATNNYEYYSVINQVDLVPTLAGLLGFTIPVRSVGIVVPQFLDFFRWVNYRPQFLFENAQQIMTLFESEFDITAINSDSCGHHCEGCLSDKSQLVCLWAKAKQAKLEWEAAQNASSEEMYHVTRTFCDHAQKLLNVPPNNPSFLHILVSVACLIALIILLFKGYSRAAPLDAGCWIFGTILVSNAVTIFINRLVVEEHHYWYWTSFVWLSYLGFKRMVNGQNWLKAVAYPVALQFLSQSLNQTGGPQHLVVEYIHNLLFDYPILFWLPGFITYVSAIDSVSRYLGLGSLFSLVASSALCLAAVVFRLSSSFRVNPELLSFAPLWFENLITGVDRNHTLNIFWTGLAACIILVFLQLQFSGHMSKKATLGGIVELSNLYLRSQTRPEHLVLFPIFDLQLKWLLSPEAELSPSDIAVTTLLLGQSAFFASGHSNSFASYDLTYGFNGIETPRVLAVALQVLFTNFLGPVWWSLASLRLLLAWLEGQNTSIPMQTEKEVTGTRPICNGASKENGMLKVHDKSQANANSSNIDKVKDSKVVNGTLPGTAIDTPPTMQGRRPFSDHLTLQTFHTAFTTLTVIFACLWRRNDPTIWTVLTPKCLNLLLYACFQQSMVHCVLCIGIWVSIVR